MLLLDDQTLAQAVLSLEALDPDLDAVYRRYGIPPLWSRPPGFATLVRIILEQQVSLASALAAFNRLNEAAGVLTPAAFLALQLSQTAASHLCETADTISDPTLRAALLRLASRVKKHDPE